MTMNREGGWPLQDNERTATPAPCNLRAMFGAVLFDLWETLINDTPERARPRRAWRSSSVQTVLRRYDLEAGIDAIEAALDAAGAALSRLHDEGKDLTAGGRAHVFMTLLEAQAGSKVPDAAAESLEQVITAMPLDIAPVVAPFAVETVASIKRRGLATALVCNTGFTTTPHLLPMLAHYGLSSHLDVMFSDKLGFAKPDTRIFAAALERIGLPPDRCAFVGDNPHTDIAGAQAAGLFAVQVGDKHRDGIVPDARIDDLSQLAAVLDLPR